MRNPSFGPWLKARREETGLSLRECARRALLSPSYLSKLERDLVEPPAEDACRRLAETLTLKPLDVLTRARRLSSVIEAFVLSDPAWVRVLARARREKVDPRAIESWLDKGRAEATGEAV